jgi:hypothetical protein
MPLLEAPAFLDRAFASSYDGPIEAVSTRNRPSQPHVVADWPNLFDAVLQWKNSFEWGPQTYFAGDLPDLDNADEAEIQADFLRYVLNPVEDVVRALGFNIKWSPPGANTRLWPHIDIRNYMNGPPKPDFRWYWSSGGCNQAHIHSASACCMVGTQLRF